MTAFKSDFLNVLQSRGFIHQISDPGSLDALAARGELTAYIGFDCTAPSLHVGSMVQIMCLYWLQQTGNKPIALMGGGTTRVGDPSGKDETRKILSIEDIERNKDGIKQVFSKFLSFGEGKHDAVMPDNAEWLTKLNWIEMLRDIGRHFSVNRMLAMDSVKLRLERDQEMSFIEFNYMILQAYDYAVLNQRYDCRLQMGGSDQWGNIVNGIDLGRRMGTPQLHALTTPLITTSSGEKMGKTASGAVWLNADMKSPYEYWQFWRNTEDADVPRFLRLFTTLPLDEIARLGGACRARRSTKPRRCWRMPRPRCCTAATPPAPRRKPRGRPSRKAPSRRTFRAWKFRAANSKPGLACWRRSSGPASSPPTARRGVRSRAADCASTMSPSPTRRWC